MSTIAELKVGDEVRLDKHEYPISGSLCNGKVGTIDLCRDSMALIKFESGMTLIIDDKDEFTLLPKKLQKGDLYTILSRAKEVVKTEESQPKIEDNTELKQRDERPLSALEQAYQDRINFNASIQKAADRAEEVMSTRQSQLIASLTHLPDIPKNGKW